MDFEFELLEPLKVQPPMPADKEVWQPTWDCFCCQDTGKIVPHLVYKIIPDFDYNSDRLPICQNCNKGHDWLHLKEFGVVDLRISVVTCKKLHEFARHDWRQTIERQIQARLKIDEAVTKISSSQNLRQRDGVAARPVGLRTPEESAIAHERHELARSNEPVVADETELDF